MKNFKVAIATIALFAFILPSAATAQDRGKGKGNSKAKQSQGMKASKAKGNNRYKVTPQNHGQYVKQLRMASKRLKDLMKGKKGKGNKKGRDYVVIDSTILEVARNIDAMLYRIEHTRDAVELAGFDIEFMLTTERRRLRTIHEHAPSTYDASLEIVLQIGL